MSRQYTLDFVKRNTTGVVLTEENIQPGSEISREYDLGFIAARCTMCEAQLYLSDDGTVMCLNACNVPYGEVMRAQRIMARLGDPKVCPFCHESIRRLDPSTDEWVCPQCGR